MVEIRRAVVTFRAFHVAYVGSAILVGNAAVMLALLLRREDVVAVGEGVAAPVAA